MVLLGAKPQECPPSQALQLVLLIAYCAVSVATAMVLYDAWDSIAHTTLELAFLYVFTQLLLINYKERIHQTFNAFLGAGTLIGVVNAVLSHLLIDQSNEESITVAELGIFSVVYFWLIVVYGYIVRHAIEVKLSTGIGIVLAYAVVSIILRQYISVILGI